MVFNQALNLPNETLDMLASPDGRYVYGATEKEIHVYDTKEKKNVRKLKNMGNAMMTVSANGRFLGCVRPKKHAVRVCVYDIQENHRELLRKEISGEVSTVFPCFSSDERHMLVCNGEINEKVWAIDVWSGECTCLYQCGEKMTITSVDSCECGILIAVCNGASPAPQGRHVYFETVESKPKVIPFDFSNVQGEFLRCCGERLVFRTKWLNDAKALIMYEGKSWTEAFQIVDLKAVQAITPAVLYRIPYSVAAGIRLSPNRKYAAGLASSFCAEKRKVETTAYAFDAASGEERFSMPMDEIWNVGFSNRDDELLIAGDGAQIVRLGDKGDGKRGKKD